MSLKIQQIPIKTKRMMLKYQINSYRSRNKRKQTMKNAKTTQNFYAKNSKNACHFHLHAIRIRAIISNTNLTA